MKIRQMTIRNILLTVLLMLPCYGKTQTFESKLTQWAENYTRYDANIKPSTVVSCYVDDESKGILDPWGRPYQVILDVDYDGKI